MQTLRHLLGYLFMLPVVWAILYLLCKTFSNQSTNSKPSPASPKGNIVGPGTFSVEVVGESNYQQSLSRLAGPKSVEAKDYRCIAFLIPEDDNPHDNLAVRVEIESATVGYLDRHVARLYRKAVEREGAPGGIFRAQARIVGGWRRGVDDEGHYGVKLDLPIGD